MNQLYDAIASGDVKKVNSFLHPSWPCMSCGKRVYEEDTEWMKTFDEEGLCWRCWEEREMERDYGEMEARA